MSHLLQMQDDRVTRAALAKLAPVAPNFLVYLYSWEGDTTDRRNCVMKITGAVFREVQRGPRKGQIGIIVKGTERSTYLTPDEVDAAK